MHYCLNTEELRQLIDYKANNSEIESDELKCWINHAENWYDKLSAFTYLFSHILEKKAKEDYDCHSLIKLLYQIENHMFFTIQEFDSKFINYMLGNLRETSLSLEDELINLQNKISEYKYRQSLRY